MANKYYDYLKPKGQQVSFSDTVNQQLMLLEQQQMRAASQQLKANKERQKTISSQEKELLGFDTEGFSDVHKEVFTNKLLHTRAKVNNFYYTGANQGEFFEDIMGLKELYGDLKRHSVNVKSERAALEGWVTGTKDWNDSNNELKDDMSTLNYKTNMWNMSGVDVDSIEYDPATGDSYAFYTDINGERLKDEGGNDVYGLVSQSPTIGSKSYFSPTQAPYGNLLPGAFSKDFSAATTRLKNNPDMSMDEKISLLRNWVTTTAQNNPSVVATALNTFKDNYGENQYESILLHDKQSKGEEEGYVPLDLKEYIDETMKFLTGNLEDTSSDDSDKQNIFPSTVQFSPQDFLPSAQFQLDIQFDSEFGQGITALMVPKTGVGKSSILVESTYQTQDPTDPRANEVSDQYRVAGVAIDESRNLMVRAEMYVSEDVSGLSPERLERLSQLQGVDLDLETKTARRKVIRNIVVPPTTRDGRQNQEYLSILGQIGYSAGATKGEQKDALMKGLQILIEFNDAQAQLAASAGAL